MISWLFALGLIFGLAGVGYQDPSQAAAALFCLVGALVGCVVRDWRVNRQVTRR